MSHLELRTHRRCAPIFFSQKGANLKLQIVQCVPALGNIAVEQQSSVIGVFHERRYLNSCKIIDN